MISLSTILEDHQPFHSEYQLQRFVVARSGGTLWGAYKQAIRELVTRIEAIKLDHIAIRRLDVDIEEIGAKLARPLKTFERRHAEIDLEEKMLRRDTTSRAFTDRLREFRYLHGLAIAYRKELGTLTEDQKRALEEEAWTHRIKAQAAIDHINTGRLLPQTIELLSAVTDDSRMEVVEAVREPESLQLWFTGLSAPVVDPTPFLLPEAEARRLLCP